MVRISNTVIGVLNILTLLLSILVVGTSIWFRVQGSSECQRFLYVPLLALGLFLLVVSLLGLIGSFCQVRWMFWIYLFVLFVLIVGMFCFSIFAVVVTNRGVGKAISGRGYKEYRLGDYSHWLQKNVVNGRNWEKFKSCLIDAQVCPTLGNDVNQQASHFYKKNLSPIQSGCCKPPTYCGFIYKNATFWTVPESGPAVPDSDCTTWSNNQETLCYGCKSCKAGVLANFMNKWRKIAIFNTSIFIFLIVVYSIGCYASRNNQARKSYKKYRGY